MSEFSRRRLERMVGIVCAAVLLTSAPGAASAVARPANVKKAVTAVEPGWPESHYPENDPAFGDAARSTDDAQVPVPLEGMTDEELAAADPAGYAQMRAQRDKVERSLLTKVRTTLKAAGVTPASEGALDSADLARASAVMASSAVSPYGYLRFTLTPNTTSQWARTGYLGMLYFLYGTYVPTTDSYRWYAVAWPARSGNNVPAYQSVIGVGPIPAHTYDFGFMYGGYRGYESDSRVEFAPGKWRLDPWTGAPYGRSCLEVHGGTGSHTFGATSGCIRIHPASISSLRSYYAYKMANKYDRATAHLYVGY